MTEIQLAAKRYDGESGLAVFTGTVPLKPGQLFETGVAGSRQLTVSLWNADGTAEIGSYVSALYPQHPDGSIKSLMVSATMAIAFGVELPLLLKVGTPPSGGGPTAHPIIDAYWMKYGRLIGCTDAFHMCASRVAPGPLVAMADPRLPAKYKTFLSDEFDLKSSHWSTYGWVLERLRVHGDLGSKRGTLTNGSAIITDIVGGVTPQTPPTTGLIIGMAVTLGSGAFGIQSGTVIQDIDPVANTITLSKPAVATRIGGYITYGPPWPWQNANYDALAPMYYRYMTTGVLDKLHEAHMLAQDVSHDDHNWVDNPAPAPARGAIGFTTGLIKYAEDYQGIPANTNFPTAEYGQAFNGNPVGGAEWQSGFKHAAYICYTMSGWGQPLGVAVSWGVRDLRGTYNGVNFGNGAKFEPGSPGFQFGTRMVWRTQRLAAVIYYMLSMPMKLVGTQNHTCVAHSPRLAANKAAYRALFQDQYWDGAERWSLTIPEGGTITYPEHPITGAVNATNAFMRGIWGFAEYFQPSPDYKNERGGYPNFGAIHMFNTLLFLYMNILEDSRLQTKMLEYVDLLYRQARKYPTPITFDGAPSPRQAWLMPYMVSNPDLYQTVGEPGAFHTWYTAPILLPLWAWAYRVTGDPKYKEIADDVATCKANASSSTAGNGHAQKTLGESYQGAFFAAAWMAGEMWGIQPLDTTAPAAPGAPSLITSTWEGSMFHVLITVPRSPEPDVAEYRLYRGATTLVAVTPQPAVGDPVFDFQIAEAQFADDFSATAVDTANPANESPQSAPLHLVGDAVAPSAPGTPQLVVMTWVPDRKSVV